MQFHTAFLCEYAPWKADYLATAFPKCKAIFKDMRELGSGRAFDLLSQSKIKVPEVARLICQKAIYNNNNDNNNNKNNNNNNYYYYVVVVLVVVVVFPVVAFQGLQFLSWDFEHRMLLRLLAWWRAIHVAPLVVRTTSRSHSLISRVPQGQGFMRQRNLFLTDQA